VNLESAEWKKEKVTLLDNKKSNNNDDFLSGTKGKKGKGKK
jgi:hypothetical protein